MFIQLWPTVCNADPTLCQPWLNGCVCWQYRPAAAMCMLKHLQRTPFTAKGTGGVCTFFLFIIGPISNGGGHYY